jgi:hypothetical protein
MLEVPTVPGLPVIGSAVDGVIDRLVAARRAAGAGDDLLGRLIAARDGDAALYYEFLI